VFGFASQMRTKGKEYHDTGDFTQAAQTFYNAAMESEVANRDYTTSNNDDSDNNNNINNNGNDDAMEKEGHINNIFRNAVALCGRFMREQPEGGGEVMLWEVYFHRRPHWIRCLRKCAIVSWCE